MYSHHMHNEHKTVENLITRLKAGETIALISDAGTPAIDPVPIDSLVSKNGSLSNVWGNGFCPCLGE
jgi:uncharacterized protein (DUF2249 family)